MNESIKQILEALLDGDVVETQMGIFYPDDSKAKIGFLPSNVFLKSMFQDDYIPQAQIWSENLGKGDAPLPSVIKRIKIKPFDLISDAFRDQGFADLGELGSLDAREVQIEGSDQGKWMIVFYPSQKLTDKL